MDAFWPAGHAIGDRALLFIKQRGNDTPHTALTGWALVGNFLSGGGSGDVRVGVWERVATSTSEAAINLPNMGNHQIGLIVTFADTSGSPTALGTTDTAASSQNANIPGGTTGGPNRLILGCVGNQTDDATDQISSWTNGTLANLTDRGGAQAINGAGGGVDLVTGDLAAAGATGAITATLALSSPRWIGFALEIS